MLLRLFVTALDTDQAARGNVSTPAASAGAGAGDEGPDPVAAAILTRLPDGSIWDVLETAIRTADGDWTWQATDDEIAVSGRVTIRSIDTLGPLIEAFAVAAIARPSLAAGPVPRQFAIDRGPSLITAAGQVLASHSEWLRRHDCPPATATRNARSLQERLAQSAKDAGDERDREIRTSPVRADVTGKVSQLARAVFRQRDITGVLFARAGKTVLGGDGLFPLTMAINTGRSHFTADEDPEWAIDSLGRQLGAGLAALSLQLLALTAARDAQARPARPADAAAAIREAIAEASGGHLAGPGGGAGSSRTVVLIPDLDYTDRNALQIERSTQNGSLTAATKRAMGQFGIEEEGLAAQVTGTIEGTLVIETSLRDRNVVAVDLARFGELRRNAPDGTRPAGPEFALHQTPDSLRPTGDGAPAPVFGSPPNLLQVQISLSMTVGIKVDDPSAVRVIRLGQ